MSPRDYILYCGVKRTGALSMEHVSWHLSGTYNFQAPSNAAECWCNRHVLHMYLEGNRFETRPSYRIL
jgi:hypothetical protein